MLGVGRFDKGFEMSRDHKGVWRAVALITLVVTSLFGLFGTWIGLLAVFFLMGSAPLGFVVYGLLLICPIFGWMAFALGCYRAATVIASPPLLLAITSLVVLVLS